MIRRMMKLSELPTHEEVLARHLAEDPDFRREWERTALARAVAVQVIAYRSAHGLSQAVLADRLGVTQPAVARLESGEHNPAFPTLLRLSEALGVELAIDISPVGRKPQVISEMAQTNVAEAFEGHGCSVLVAVA
jgi:ribosome-binding protein aMBF1 (putative translation factor)